MKRHLTSMVEIPTWLIYALAVCAITGWAATGDWLSLGIAATACVAWTLVLRLRHKATHTSRSHP